MSGVSERHSRAIRLVTRPQLMRDACAQYRVMLDPSGRATCKGKCKEKIPKGELRFGAVSTGSWDGEMVLWRRLSCVTATVARNALNFHGEIADIPGFDALPPEQAATFKEVMDTLINGGTVGTPAKELGGERPEAEERSQPEKKKSKKAAKAAKAQEAAAAQQAADEATAVEHAGFAVVTGKGKAPSGPIVVD